MPLTADIKDISLLLDSQVPIIVIESFEEPRVLEMITRLAVSRASPLYNWSSTEGLCLLGFGSEVPKEAAMADPTEVLTHIKTTPSPGIYVLCDFHPYLKDEPINVRLLREIAMRHHRLGHIIILLSYEFSLPNEIKRYSAKFELSMPTEDQLETLVREEASNWSKSQGGRPVRSDPATFKQLVHNLKGVPLQEARQLVRGVIYDDGAILESDIPGVNEAKFALMDMEGVLSFEYDTAQFTEVGGLKNLKKWLKERRDGVIGVATNLDTPKGIMLLGIQGSGKSLAAKAVAGMWGLPLLRLDFGSLYNKFFGETERNLRQSLALADMMSPCVLWLDEIEKGISTSQSDSGISQRLLGTLLTWMAERKSMAFIVATSNDISQLPPELVRKGRLDEIFFVDLPMAKTRQEIFSIHLKKRKEKASDFDLVRLARQSEGFSGSEIEQAIVSALYSVAASDRALKTKDILASLTRTNPLSIVMFERIESLREWAKERCIFAN